MNALQQLAERWRRDAELLDSYGASAAAEACRLHARQLEDAAASFEDEPLTLAEAAAESGYSERRLRELLSTGEIPQAGRKGSPRIRRRDLPRKPGTTAAAGYDPAADAQDLLRRM